MIPQNKICKPLLKWAGGKSMLLPFLIPKFLKQDENAYIEPFIGDGSVALALQCPNMILNDKNIKLMNFHEQVQKRPEKLHRKIIKYINVYNNIKNRKEQGYFFYKTREKYNSLTLSNKNNGLTHASLFWFLNKTCFNGMYRENPRGDFNIPFGNVQTHR